MAKAFKKDLLAEKFESVSLGCQTILLSSNDAPAMVGLKEGFCGLLKKNDITCLTVHCLIHQEALCGKAIKMSLAMKLVTSITNFITVLENACSTSFLIRKEILQFLQEVVSSDTAHFEKALMDKDMLSELAFLTDFTEHMNNLNLKLQ
ncbi:general transcription factor II-I repeat domain-containing protein 2-like, partial [Formica exsecta]|uniref:general transcription factor II-I repeat domain-containing protein 2-like n=1 Tax=Formica exsecta TaxID=72781 RepID=UPI0011427FE6